MDLAMENNFVASNLIYPAILFAIVLYFVHFVQTRSRVWALTSGLPSPPALPIVGHLFYGFVTPEEAMKLAVKYSLVFGNTLRVWALNRMAVFLSDPRDVELILGSQVHLEKAPEYQFFKPWLGDGLLISKGDKWRHHRKLIAPTFHQNVLKSFIELFNQNSRNITKRMEKEIGHEFDVHDYMSTVTVDILTETAMGFKRTKKDSTGFDYAIAVMKMCDIIHQRTYKLWLWPEVVFGLSWYGKQQKVLLNKIHSLTNKIIQEKKQAFSMEKPKVTEEAEIKYAEVEEFTLEAEQKGPFLRDDLDDDVGEKKRIAFLDMMLEQQHETKMTNKEIKEEVDTIMFEGHDTTAAGSSFVLCLLGVHHDIQDQVYKELHDIFGNSDRPVTFLDTVNMKYLERVIMESLRLYPPVPLIARMINEDVKLTSVEQVLPSGTTVLIPTFNIHRLKSVYGPDAATFNPDNFLPERMQNRHYYSYIPFSAGPRSCVGRKYAMLKLKVLLATILRTYRVHSDVPEKDFRLISDIILKRKDGFRILIEKRTQTSM